MVSPICPSISLPLHSSFASRVKYELIIKGWLFKRGQIKISVFKLFQVSLSV